MTELKNDRYLRTLLRQPVDVTPVWMMRQASHYSPEYKVTRAQAGDFMSLCKDAELACEATLQPLRRYPLGAVILFSDILTIPDAMGLRLYFGTGGGSRLTSPIKSKTDIDKLPVPDPGQKLGYVMNAVRTIRRELKGEVSLIGFSDSPWTLATYMVEGGSSKAFIVIKKMIHAEPQALHVLLRKLVKSVTLYLNTQIKAGAQSMIILNTWGGMLTGCNYQQFSFYYIHRIVDGLLQENEGRRMPMTLLTKDGGQWLEAMMETGCDALGLNWTADIADARHHVGYRVALQGSMGPSMLYVPTPRIREEVATILTGFGQGEGHVFSLSHGIRQDVDPQHAGVFVETVHRLSTPYYQQEISRMDLAALRTQRQRLAASVGRTDQLDRDSPALIGGTDVGFEQEGKVTRATMVLLTRPELKLVEYQMARVATTMPYIPGSLSFRETPAPLAARKQLSQRPSLLFVDGYGIFHPRQFGVISHFGLMTDVPTIGVAEKRLCGKIGELGDEPGALAPLIDKNEQLAWVWCSKVRCNPLFISTGHQVGMDNTLMWVERCMRNYRLPEPTRQADAVASRRPSSMRWQTSHN